MAPIITSQKVGPFGKAQWMSSYCIYQQCCNKHIASFILCNGINSHDSSLNCLGLVTLSVILYFATLLRLRLTSSFHYNTFHYKDMRSIQTCKFEHKTHQNSLTLISPCPLLCQGDRECGLLCQPPHQLQERAVGPGPQPGSAEPEAAQADSAEPWDPACHCCWSAHCHKGVQVAVPQPPLELPDHPQSGNIWQNCQPW